MNSGLDLDSLRELIELLQEYKVAQFSNGTLSIAFSGNATYNSNSKQPDIVKQERQLTERELELMANIPKDLQHLYRYER